MKMDHALQGDNNNRKKNPFKILKKKQHISMADYKVSPHTERIFKRMNSSWMSIKIKGLDYTKGRGTKSASCFHFHIDLHTIIYTPQRLRCQ
ncbi:type II toxin-antitoxin system SpoIISB family antitoxin [Bacillus sp. SL00103]